MARTPAASEIGDPMLEVVVDNALCDRAAFLEHISPDQPGRFRVDLRAEHLRRLGERRVGAGERLQETEQPVDLGVRVARAHVARPAEAAGLVHGHDERAEAAGAASLALRVADDHDLLALPHLHLAPVRAPPARLVARVEPLRDDAVEARVVVVAAEDDHDVGRQRVRER